MSGHLFHLCLLHLATDLAPACTGVQAPVQPAQGSLSPSENKAAAHTVGAAGFMSQHPDGKDIKGSGRVPSGGLHRGVLGEVNQQAEGQGLLKESFTASLLEAGTPVSPLRL